MLEIINYVLDVLFPPRSTERQVRSISALSHMQAKLIRHSPETYSLLSYEWSDVRAVITENKFYNNRRAAKLLASVLENWLKSKHNLVLIPIPLSKQRQQERGYNQVQKILDALPDSTRYQIDKNILIRTTDTTPQSSLKKAARIENVRNAFTCQKPELLQLYAGKTLVIIDDVTTTGSTFVAAQSELQKHLCPETKIVCLALAH